MKDRLRRWLGPERWGRLAALRRRSRDVAVSVSGPVLAAPASWAPAPVRIEAGSRIRALEAVLDFPDRALRIGIASTVEWDMRRFPCRKEPETVAWLRRTLRAGDLVADVGANVGAYSLIAAALEAEARVLAFEPVPITYASLCANVATNGLAGRITPLAVALGDRDGLLRFGIGNSDAGAAGHGGLHHAADDDLELLGWRLDSLLVALGLECPTHLKIDVDGSEHLVLSGAEGALRDPRLRTILLEVDLGVSQLDLLDPVLEAAGFAMTEEHRHPPGDTYNRIYERS